MPWRQTTLMTWLATIQAGTTAAYPIVIDDDDIMQCDHDAHGFTLFGSSAAHPIEIADDDDLAFHALDRWPQRIPQLPRNKNPFNIRFADMNLGKCTCQLVCSRSHCENSKCAIYCDKDNCDVGAGCGNRLFDHESLQIMRCTKGYGVKTTSIIPANTVLGEYRGTIVPEYMLTLDQVQLGFVLRFKSLSTKKEMVFVDASPGGSICRFVNHSCAPNSKFEERAYRRSRKMVITSKRQIRAGEEVTVKYGKHITFVCLCGESTCQRWQLS